MSDDYLPPVPRDAPDKSDKSDTSDAGDSGDVDEAESARSLPPLREVAEIRKPSTLGGVIYLGVLAGALVGVGIAATGAWRTGVSWLAFSLLVAALSRLVLPDDNAGMLRVRRRMLDAGILILLGVSLLVLATTIPDQPR